MNAMTRRVRRIEQRFLPQIDEEGRRRVALLLARRQRFAQERGERTEMLPSYLASSYDGPQTTAILQTRRN